MNLAERLNEESLSIEEKRKAVEDEIVDYFKKIFESGRFEQDLEKTMTEKDKGKRSRAMCVEFWDHHSGCSDTQFSVWKYVWENPEGKCYESCRYKGVRLIDIQRDVGKRLLNLTEYYLKEMGFMVDIVDCESWLKYYSKKITICW